MVLIIFTVPLSNSCDALIDQRYDGQSCRSEIPNYLFIVYPILPTYYYDPQSSAYHQPSEACTIAFI
jgi:hypothetical protein